MPLRYAPFFLAASLWLYTDLAYAQTIWWENGMVKLRRQNGGITGDPVPAAADLCSALGCRKGGVALSAARNEFEPFQIVVAAGGSAIAGVDITVSDLKDSRGNLIVATGTTGIPKNIVIYREHYLSIDPARLSSDAGVPGFWPDALIPKVDEYFGERRKVPGETAFAFPFNVPANQKQAVWIDIYVPLGTPGGVYTGAARVTIGGAPAATIPITLTVRNFDLPSTPSLKSAYSLGVGELGFGHYGTRDLGDSKFLELICLYTKEMLLHRLSNSDVVWPKPQWNSALGSIDWSLPALSTTCNQRYPQFLAGASDLLPNGKLPGAKVTRARLRDGTGSGAAIETAAYYKSYLRRFSDMGWKSQLFYYLWEEPAYPLTVDGRRCDITWYGTPSSAWIDLYHKSKFFKDNALDIPMMVTTNRQSFEDCFVRYLKVPDYLRYIDIWAVGNMQMHGEPTAAFPFNANLRATYDAVLPFGKELWWYQACGNQSCVGSETNFPAPMVDYPSTYTRVYRWLTYNYQAGYKTPGPQTELYYEVVYAYGDFDGHCNSTTPDPWSSVYCFTGNGDGTLFYPGRPDKIGGKTHIPISSIRLKMIREGIEDYEYLALLEERKNKQGVDGKGWIKANILDNYLSAKDPNDGLSKFITYVWSKDPMAMLNAREEVGKILDSVSDFSISFFPSTAKAVLGKAIAAQFTISSFDGFSAPISLTCSGVGIACGLYPLVTPRPNENTLADLWVVSLPPTSPGLYSVTVTGVSGGLVRQALLTFVLQDSDSFDRPNNTDLGQSWVEYAPDLEIYNNEVRNRDGGSKEAVFSVAVGPDQSVAVDCKVMVVGNSCGVMARWWGASNFYYARLDPGAGDIVLYSKVNNVYTPLAAVARPLGLNTFYRLRLVVKGSAISLYFASEPTPAIALNDTALPNGSNAGIRAYTNAPAAVSFDNFKVTLP